MSALGVTRKAALTFLSSISTQDVLPKNQSDKDHTTTNPNSFNSKPSKGLTSPVLFNLDLPPDPDLESQHRIRRSTSSINSPKSLRKPLRSKRDKAATLFLSSIGTTGSPELVEEVIEYATSPLSISIGGDQEFGIGFNERSVTMSSLDRKSTRSVSNSKKSVYSSSSSDSSSDEEALSLQGKDSYEGDNCLSSSRRSSYLLDPSNHKVLSGKITSNSDVILIESQPNPKSKDSLRTRTQKGASKSKGSKKNKHDSYMYLLNPKNTLSCDPDSDYNPMFLDDPNLLVEEKSTGFSSIMDSLFSFGKDETIDEPEDLFQESHPTVNESLSLSHIRIAKSKLFEICQAMDLELSSLAIAFVYFEKLCLKGLISRENRKIRAAVCLFLAVKTNEHKTMLTGLFDAFDKYLDVDEKEIRSCEFSTFAELEFSLFIPQSEFMPHLERILHELGIPSVNDYVLWKSFYQ